MYSLFRPILFKLDAEKAHDFALKAIKQGVRGPIARAIACSVPDSPRELMGLKFPNPVGLAAGMDKNGYAINAWSGLGFGFVEIGTITPRPQPGNPSPRMFRIPEKEALINRLGFNNKGVDYLIRQVIAANFDGILGINIGKNFDTAVENAADDYLTCLQKVYPHASYVTINISSPNTEGLRGLQHGDQLEGLFSQLKKAQKELQIKYSKYVPLVVKIAPDLESNEIVDIAAAILAHDIDGVIATNTTLSRDGVSGYANANESGGLSGGPLTTRSTEVLEKLVRELKGNVPVIASGGVMSGQDAQAKIDAGASLVQLLTGFVYRGPGLIREVAQQLSRVG